MLSLGITVFVLSVFFVSSFMAIIGIALIFWCGFLLYVAPVKQVPVDYLTTLLGLDVSNIDRIIVEMNLSEKGIYLPPKNLKHIESSLIYIPKSISATLPKPEEDLDRLSTKQKDGFFITPIGLPLSNLLETTLGQSFMNIENNNLQEVLYTLFVEKLEIAEGIEIQFEKSTVGIEIVGSIFASLCDESKNLSRTHSQVGCILSSAMACILAKTTGKPIKILTEKKTGNALLTTYHIEDE